jgi:hypothetical protein
MYAIHDFQYIIMPYVKPCYGRFVLRIKGKAEIERLRAGVCDEPHQADSGMLF